MNYGNRMSTKGWPVQSFRIEELTLTLAWRKKFGDISTGIGAFDIYEALRGTM